MYKFLSFLILSLFFVNCNEQKTTQRLRFAIETNSNNYTLGDSLKITLSNPQQIKIVNTKFFLEGKSIAQHTLLDHFKLGDKTLSAVISYDDKTDSITKNITIFNNKIPDIYTFEIINTFPHDINSYTQGLEFYNGELYESTGQYKTSKLRKIDYKTGEVLQNLNLSDNYFGEGLTILDKKIHLLTWRAKTGFIYDLSFKKLKSFKYGQSKEGWGLCNDGDQLYKSDGTEHIWFLDKNNLTEQGYIQATTEKGKIPSLNELEFINGKIYANIYQRNGVVIINPKNGAVEGVIDFKTLKDKVTQHPKLDVLNGIAYHPQRETIFVTGKNWDKLFEVKIKKK